MAKYYIILEDGETIWTDDDEVAFTYMCSDVNVVIDTEINKVVYRDYGMRTIYESHINEAQLADNEGEFEEDEEPEDF